MKATERDEILFDVATDIKSLKRQREADSLWLQKSLDRIEVHLVTLNGTTMKHGIGIGINKWTIRTAVLGLIALVLKVLNVF